MIKRLALLIICLTTGPTDASQDIPENTKAQNIVTQFNLFKRIAKKSTLHLSYAFGINKTLPNSNRFRVSYRQKLSKNISAGAFSILASGSRHNADWHNPNGTWKWRDSKERYELNYGLYFQYKRLINTKRDLLLKTRVLYQVNNFNNQQELIVRAGLLSLITSKISWLNQVDFHIPTNYQRSFLREFWIYSGLGRQMTKNIFLAFQVSYGTEIWNESKDFFDRTGAVFKNTNDALRIGPLLNFYY